MASSSASSYPCLSNICLNDPISTVADKVQWVDLAALRTQPPSNSSYTRQWIGAYVKGLSTQDQEFLVPYVSSNIFDKKLLSFLNEKKPVFCRQIGFEGGYISEGGYQTSIHISLDANSIPRITSMERTYPSQDNVQLEAIANAIYKQFPFLADRRMIVPPWGTGYAAFHHDKLLFDQYVNNEGASDRSLSQQASCNVPKASVD